MTATRRSLTCLAAGCLTALLAGCAADPRQGYSFSSPHPAGIRTVAVPMWTRSKQVYRRQWEMRLTEALQKHIELHTPYKVTKEGRADTVMTGRIDRITQQVVSTNTDTGLPRQNEITFVVSFTWTDLRTGKVLLTRRNFRVTGTYLPGGVLSRNPTTGARMTGPPMEEFFEGGEDVVNRVARRIVEQMEAKW